MKSTMTSIFRDRMSVYYAVRLGRADFEANLYGELRNVAEQKVRKLKRPAQWLVFAAHYVRQAKERRRRAKERGWSSLHSMCGKLTSVAALVVGRPTLRKYTFCKFGGRNGRFRTDLEWFGPIGNDLDRCGLIRIN